MTSKEGLQGESQCVQSKTSRNCEELVAQAMEYWHARRPEWMKSTACDSNTGTSPCKKLTRCFAFIWDAAIARGWHPHEISTGPVPQVVFVKSARAGVDAQLASDGGELWTAVNDVIHAIAWDYDRSDDHAAPGGNDRSTFSNPDVCRYVRHGSASLSFVGGDRPLSEQVILVLYHALFRFNELLNNFSALRSEASGEVQADRAVGILSDDIVQGGIGRLVVDVVAYLTASDKIEGILNDMLWRTCSIGKSERVNRKGFWRREFSSYKYQGSLLGVLILARQYDAASLLLASPVLTGADRTLRHLSPAGTRTPFVTIMQRGFSTVYTHRGHCEVTEGFHELGLLHLFALSPPRGGPELLACAQLIDSILALPCAASLTATWGKAGAIRREDFVSGKGNADGFVGCLVTPLAAIFLGPVCDLEGVSNAIDVLRRAGGPMCCDKDAMTFSKRSVDESGESCDDDESPDGSSSEVARDADDDAGSEKAEVPGGIPQRNAAEDFKDSENDDNNEETLEKGASCSDAGEPEELDGVCMEEDEEDEEKEDGGGGDLGDEYFRTLAHHGLFNALVRRGRGVQWNAIREKGMLLAKRFVLHPLDSRSKLLDFRQNMGLQVPCAVALALHSSFPVEMPASLLLAAQTLKTASPRAIEFLFHTPVDASLTAATIDWAAVESCEHEAAEQAWELVEVPVRSLSDSSLWSVTGISAWSAHSASLFGRLCSARLDPRIWTITRSSDSQLKFLNKKTGSVHDEHPLWGPVLAMLRSGNIPDSFLALGGPDMEVVYMPPYAYKPLQRRDATAGPLTPEEIPAEGLTGTALAEKIFRYVPRRACSQCGLPGYIERIYCGPESRYVEMTWRDAACTEEDLESVQRQYFPVAHPSGAHSHNDFVASRSISAAFLFAAKLRETLSLGFRVSRAMRGPSLSDDVLRVLASYLMPELELMMWMWDQLAAGHALSVRLTGPPGKSEIYDQDALVARIRSRDAHSIFEEDFVRMSASTEGDK